MTTPVRPPKNNKRMARGRSLCFARLRVVTFTATAGVACTLLGTLVGACSDGREETTPLLDAAAPPPPGACVVKRTTTKLCDAAADPDDGAADAAADADALAEASVEAGPSDAAAPDGGGIALAPPESENRCLVTEDVTIACPSKVSSIEAAEAKGGATDIVLSQVGFGRYASPTNASLVPDGRAHVQHLRIDPSVTANVVIDPIPPYEAAETLPGGAYALLAASGARESQLLFFGKDSDAALTLRSGALGATPVALSAPFQVAASISSRPNTFSSPSGEGFFLSQPRGGPPYHGASGPIVMVRGLPDAPRVVTTSISPVTYIGRTDPAGQPVLLFHDGQNLRLREGEDFGTERWSTELPLSGSGTLIDVAYVKRGGQAVPVVLYSDRNGVGIRFADANQRAVGLTRLGESFSTCPRSTYVGITCDACPVDKSCETGSDAIGHARLFTRDDRLFAVFLATDTRRRMGYARSVIPIIDVGCACTLEERSKTAVADSLVVVEVVSRDDKPTPIVIEWMRIPLYKAGTTGHVAFEPRRDGDVDVIVGGQLARYDSTPGRQSEKPTEYRVIRLSTSLVP